MTLYFWWANAFDIFCDGPLSRYVTSRVAHAPRMSREHFPHHRLQRKPLVSDPSMHHGTCITMHVGIANPRRGKRSSIPSNFRYLARGPWCCNNACQVMKNIHQPSHCRRKLIKNGPCLVMLSDCNQVRRNGIAALWIMRPPNKDPSITLNSTTSL